MPHRLAFFTCGIMHEPVGHPRTQGFLDRAPGVYAVADGSAGFHSRSVRDYDTWEHSWGDPVIPKCYPMPAGLDANSPARDILQHFAMTLSLWQDLESVAAFAYKGAHAEALACRKDWFQSLGLPPYVAWWASAEDQVNWKQAAERLDHLHTHGPSSFAFNFSKPFDSTGNSVRFDQWAMQAHAKKNATPQL